MRTLWCEAGGICLPGDSSRLAILISGSKEAEGGEGYEARADAFDAAGHHEERLMARGGGIAELGRSRLLMRLPRDGHRPPPPGKSGWRRRGRQGGQTGHDSHNVALGRAIRRLRKKAKLTQRELAERAGVPVKELRLIENGVVNADWGTVRHLAYGMEVKLADVFRLTENLAAESGS